jgi:hypothetical protein
MHVPELLQQVPAVIHTLHLNQYLLAVGQFQLASAISITYLSPAVEVVDRDTMVVVVLED